MTEKIYLNIYRSGHVLIACIYLLLTVLGSSFVWRALS